MRKKAPISTKSLRNISNNKETHGRKIEDNRKKIHHTSKQGNVSDVMARITYTVKGNTLHLGKNVTTVES